MTGDGRAAAIAIAVTSNIAPSPRGHPHTEALFDEVLCAK
ncbi:hypothetical protein GCM10010345_85670 [Streptomyces canarius]|uniref:Uncharacterized protein n=1 Tax=Streptomyces canarius TaxID=285453 RepID=A0ABQ3DAF9_9ACTN|nr:hypothetical protein GCM10010345_85670 [Streptomyces canarius]